MMKPRFLLLLLPVAFLLCAIIALFGEPRSTVAPDRADGTGTPAAEAAPCPSYAPHAARPAPIPIYPGATNVSKEEFADPIQNSPEFQDSRGDLARITTFESTDSADQILDFYRDTLTSAGWRGGQTGIPGTLSFSWSVDQSLWTDPPCNATAENGMSTSVARVEVTQGANGGAMVQIVEGLIPGM